MITVDDLDKISEQHDASFVELIWADMGDKFDYPWPDIRLMVEFDGDAVGVMLPKGLMSETAEKIVILKSGLCDIVSRDHLQIALDDAVAKFGRPSRLGVQ